MSTVYPGPSAEGGPVLFRRTRSVCPVCLRNLPAALVRGDDGRVFLEKTCPDHGTFRALVWEGRTDFSDWLSGTDPLAPDAGLACPQNCGLCPEHESDSCCVLLEVTRRCDLHCAFCFADGGSSDLEPSLEDCEKAIRDIVRQCGSPLLQLSGGEPTLRDDLPELAAFAKEAGCSYVQVNTNGLRLARDAGYVHALAGAGTDIVFLQFDGTDDRIYKALRGRELFREKEKAIEACGEAGIGVTLVPTVVRGVNDDSLGDIVRYAVSHAPAVRAVHFQPVSYFGRCPGKPSDEGRYTLDRLMADLSAQAAIPFTSFLPSRCDHPLCGFHASFLIRPDGSLRPLASVGQNTESRSARDNREYVARRWRRAEDKGPAPAYADEMDLDSFLYHLRHRSLTLSAMAFQDASNLNVERLHRCSLHVYDDGVIKPFCAKYLTAMPEEG